MSFTVKYGVLATLLGMVLVTSCLKEDEPVAKVIERQVVQIPMGNSYAKQYFYSLSDNVVIEGSQRDSWDLAFESTPKGYRVFLNSAKLMSAYAIDASALNSIVDYNAAAARYDAASGDPDATAIGNWGQPNNNNVLEVINSANKAHVIDRGRDVSGGRFGQVKVVFKNLVDNTYTLAFGNLDDSTLDTFSITKAEGQNFVYMSFDEGGKEVFAEPQNNLWDLVFTMYTNVFVTDPGGGIPFSDGDTIPYLVNGVLLNGNGIEAAQLVTTAFDSVDVGQVANLSFSTNWDAIGWDWKSFQLSNEGYVTDTTKVYIVKDRNNDLFKLRFIDFYDETGERGYPTFEVELIQ